MIISFVNQKGGVGKSTLSFHFTCWLHEQGYSVGFFDADAQKSSSKWMQDYAPEIPLGVVDLTRPNDVPQEVLRLAEAARVVVCDGPGGLGEVTRTLLVLSDVALFPIAASYLDAESLAEAKAQLAYASSIHPARPPTASVVLNKVRKRARLAKDARAAVGTLGIDVCRSVVRDLDAFKIAPQERTTVWRLGRGGAQATSDLHSLFEELRDLLGISMEVAAYV